jgi:hypothetical protein
MDGTCQSLAERIAVNSENSCPVKFLPVFPESVGYAIAPAILLIGMTIVGYGLSTGRGWATNFFISPSTQLAVMFLLMAADHGSTFWDHSRVSNENYCLTASITGSALDGKAGRVGFGVMGALLSAAAMYGVKSGSVSITATAIPFATMMGYLAWSPQDFQSCKNNALVTGLLAYGLDIMTFVGILQTLFAASGNSNRSWEKWTVLYSLLISGLFALLIGRDSDYGERITPGTCEINDEADEEEEKLIDRTPELSTGLIFSALSLFYVIYLKAQYSEVSCCAVMPVIGYLLFDMFNKIQVWKRGEPLVGDAINRSLIYTIVQSMDIMLSSSSLVSIMKDVGMVGKAVIKGPSSIVGHALHFVKGPFTYIQLVVQLILAMVQGKGFDLPNGTFKKIAEVVKLIGLNVVANIIPFAIDQKNATYMLNANPQNDLNTKCMVR